MDGFKLRSNWRSRPTLWIRYKVSRDLQFHRKQALWNAKIFHQSSCHVFGWLWKAEFGDNDILLYGGFFACLSEGCLLSGVSKHNKINYFLFLLHELFSMSSRGPNSQCEFAILRIFAKRKRIRFALRDLISLSLRFAECESVRKKLSQFKEISPKILRISSKEPHSKALGPPVKGE